MLEIPHTTLSTDLLTQRTKSDAKIYIWLFKAYPELWPWSQTELYWSAWKKLDARYYLAIWVSSIIKSQNILKCTVLSSLLSASFFNIREKLSIWFYRLRVFK